MKNFIKILIVLSFGFTFQNAEAKRVIRVGTQEELRKVADLPNNEDYMMPDGGYLDLGIKYKQFVFALPIWVTEDPVYVGLSTANPDVYYDIPQQDLADIAKENNLDLKKLNKLSFTDRYLGLLILILGVAAITWWKMRSGRESEDVIEENPNPTTTTTTTTENNNNNNN